MGVLALLFARAREREREGMRQINDCNLRFTAQKRRRLSRPSNHSLADRQLRGLAHLSDIVSTEAMSLTLLRLSAQAGALFLRQGAGRDSDVRDGPVPGIEGAQQGGPAVGDRRQAQWCRR
jgi:hypothetical protein